MNQTPAGRMILQDRPKKLTQFFARSSMHTALSGFKPGTAHSLPGATFVSSSMALLQPAMAASTSPLAFSARPNLKWAATLSGEEVFYATKMYGQCAPLSLTPALRT